MGVQPGGCWWSTPPFQRCGAGRRAGGAIAALREALGPAGTLVMPGMTEDDDPFDPRQTPCPGLGVVADTFWRMPGVLRSNSPFSFSAAGAQAGSRPPTRPMLLTA